MGVKCRSCGDLTCTACVHPSVHLIAPFPPSLQKGGLSNLVNLDEFGEGAVIHQLRERYSRDEIYTNIGTILVSVNPYKALPIYGAQQVDNYRAAAETGPQALAALEPHIFAIAAQAYALLYEDSEASNANIKHNQAVIISGESGAGQIPAGPCMFAPLAVSSRTPSLSFALLALLVLCVGCRQN